MQWKDFQPLRECPFCGGEARLMQYGEQEYLPTCNECDCVLDYCFYSAEEATAAWNRRALPENEPPTNDALTRDELYYLDGEPLYVMDGEGHECYCVVNTKNEDCIDNEAGAWCFEFYDMTGDGKHGLHKMGWRAYRTKPERSE